jgi:hypothetical protein
LARGEKLKGCFNLYNHACDEPYYVDDDSYYRALGQIAEAKQAMRAETKCRRLITAEQRGLLGLVPIAMQRNDIIVILIGHKVPVVIRPGSTGKNEKYFKLVGEAYVDGTMHWDDTTRFSKKALIEPITFYWGRRPLCLSYSF